MWALLSLKTCFNFLIFFKILKLLLLLLLLLLFSVTPTKLLGIMRIKSQKVMGTVFQKIECFTRWNKMVVVPFFCNGHQTNGGGKNKLGDMTSDFSQRIGIGLYANMLKNILTSYKLSNGKVL